MQSVKLFCLPHAGGSAAIYNRWKKYLHKGIDLNPIELNGRGRLHNKLPPSTFALQIDDLYQQIVYLGQDADIILFGHSFGGLIVYEVCRRLIHDACKIPLHLFVSGIRPPHYGYESDYWINQLPDDQFVKEVQKLGGMAPEIIANKELLDFFLPIIRLDYELLETYRFIPDASKLNCDLTVLYGDEETDNHKMAEWEEYTCKKYTLREFKGNHFFICDKEREVVDMINSVITG